MSLAAWTWSCLRPYRGRVAILTTIAVTNVALGVLAPWPLKLVVDNVLEGRPLPGALDRIGVALAGDSRAALLVLVVCGGLLLQVLTQTLSMINVQVQVDTGQRLVYALRARLLAHLQALALRHHVVTRTADSVYRLEADAYCVHDLVMSGLLNLFVSVLTLWRCSSSCFAWMRRSRSCRSRSFRCSTRVFATTRPGWWTAHSR